MGDLSAQILATMPAHPTMRDINDACLRFGLPSLAQGMIELPPPDALRSLARDVVGEDVHMYRARGGEPDYLAAIGNLLERHYGAQVRSNDISGHPLQPHLFATLGVSGALAATVIAARPKSRPARIAIVEPFYTYHLYLLETLLGTQFEVVPVPMSRDPAAAPADNSTTPTGDNPLGLPHCTGAPFRLDMDAVQKALDGGIDLFIVCNPSNPTGCCLDEKVVKDLIGAAGAASVPQPSGSRASAVTEAPLLLFDECYCDLVWGDGAPSPFWSPVSLGVEVPLNVVVARGFSKQLGCQSWRVGYGFTAPSLVPLLTQGADPLYLCAPFLQHALGRFLTTIPEGFSDHTRAVGALMRRNLSVLVPAFHAAFGWECVAPQGSMYAFFEHKQSSDTAAVVQALSAGVGVCPGSIFFHPSTMESRKGSDGNVNSGFIRVHVGVSERKADDVVARLVAVAEARQGK